MDNLIAFVIGETSTNYDQWLNIPYPQGYTPNNSMVIIQSLGNVSSAKFIFKISTDRNKFVAQSISSPDYKPLFIFMRISG